MTRLTLQHPNMPGFIIDMSIVKMRHNALHFKDSGVFEEQELYEIELELNDHYKPIQDVSKMSEHIKKNH